MGEDLISKVVKNEFYSLSYQRFLEQKKLMGSKCKKCKSTFVPPKPICPKCYSGEMELTEMKGRGKLIAYTVVTVGSPLMAEEGFDREHPYCSGVVELEEGPKVTARIIGVDMQNPEKINLGTPLTVEYQERAHGGENKTFLAFSAKI